MKTSKTVTIPNSYGHSYDLSELAQFVEEGMKAAKEGFNKVVLTGTTKGVELYFKKERV